MPAPEEQQVFVRAGAWRGCGPAPRCRYLTWHWKVTQLPSGGDFRHASTDDQAAQVLVAFDDRRILSYIWDTNAPKGRVAECQFYPASSTSIPWSASRARAEANRWVDGEPQRRGRLRDARMASPRLTSRVCACRSIRSTPDRSRRATSAKSPSAARCSNDPGYRRNRLHRQSSSRKGFPAHTCPCAASFGARKPRRLLPSGVEPAYGDLVTGEGLEEALRGVDTVIHLAGVTKALRASGLLCRQCPCHRDPGDGRCAGSRRASCMSAPWRP